MRHRGGSGSVGDLITQLVFSELFIGSHRPGWRIGNNIHDCILCGKCEDKCSIKALSVDKSKKTWKLNNRVCNHCLNCVMVCPKRCLSQVSI